LIGWKRRLNKTSTKTDKETKTCVLCGKILVGKQDKYCSRKCTVMYMHVAHEMGRCENPRCNNEFLKRSKNQRFCCTKCKDTVFGDMTVKINTLNRPFTSQTKSIIKMWYNNGKGNSKVEIAQILGRSLESVEKAFD
jgi:ribosomal protein L37AE/L43A